MTHYFISDLHLNAEELEIHALFLAFIQALTSGDRLYILGDFFNAWVGDDAMTPFDKQVQSELKSLVCKGVKIFMLYGNRDFLMRENFFTKTGITFLEDETVIELNGKKTLLMHGDTLCTDDKRYLQYRKIVRNPWVQKLFLCLPLTFRRWIANKLRNNSQKYFDRTKKLVDVNQTAVETIMQKYGVSQLIHGHTHLPNAHDFSLSGKPAKRFVLGAWHASASVLKTDLNEALKLIQFP